MLDVGRRQRSVGWWLRKALEARDGGCRFPGCGSWLRTHAHHITPWAQGGETATEEPGVAVPLRPPHRPRRGLAGGDGRAGSPALLQSPRRSHARCARAPGHRRPGAPRRLGSTPGGRLGTLGAGLWAGPLARAARHRCPDREHAVARRTPRLGLGTGLPLEGRRCGRQQVGHRLAQDGHLCFPGFVVGRVQHAGPMSSPDPPCKSPGRSPAAPKARRESGPSGPGSSSPSARHALGVAYIATTTLDARSSGAISIRVGIPWPSTTPPVSPLAGEGAVRREAPFQARTRGQRSVPSAPSIVLPPDAARTPNSRGADRCSRSPRPAPCSHDFQMCRTNGLTGRIGCSDLRPVT